MYEIFTLGGGTYLVDLLNAVAAITSGGAYVVLAQLSGVAGLAWVLFRTAFGGSWKDNAKWILLFVAVWGAMIVPRATVRVVDRLDPALAPAVVANVPVGLALFASLTSQVGDGLTRLTEQAFALPNDLAYQRHGLIFGARLAAAATRLEVTDAVFARNLRSFSRQCVFYALLLGHVSADELRESTDLWRFATSSRTPSAGASPARMTEFAARNEDGGVDRAVVTCAEAAARLNAQWAAELQRAGAVFGRRLFPDTATDALARAELMVALPAAHHFLIGISLVAQAGIRAVAADVAVMSGYLSMSVPFLAAALAYGLSKATVLAVGQDAASSAAHEGTTGNLSLGNTSADTHRFATLDGRQIRTSAHVDDHRFSGFAPGGAAYTVTGDSTVVTDAGAATSRIPAAGVRLSESLAVSHEQRAAQARGLSQAFSVEAGTARSAAVTDATRLAERYARDVSTGEAFARGVTESESAQVQALESHVERMSETAGISKSRMATLAGEARIGGGWNFIAKLGADGSASWRGQTIEKESWDRLKGYAESHQVLDLWSKVSEASRRYSTSTGDSEHAGLEESLGANLTDMRRFEERAALSRQESESWSEQVARVRSEAQAIDRELGQPFFVWLSERTGADGRPIETAGAIRIASPQTPEDTEVLRSHAAAFVAERFPAPAGPDPASVGGEAEYGARSGSCSRTRNTRPTGSRACPGPSVPRRSTPSSPAPPARAKGAEHEAASGCGRAWDAGAGIGDRGDGSRLQSSGRAD